MIDQVLWLLFGVIMGASMLLVAGDGPDAHVRVALVLNISAMAWSVTTVVRSFFLLSVAPLCGIPALILVVQRDQEDVLLACGCATVFLLCVFYHQTSSRTVRTLFTLQDQLSYDNAELAKEVDAISQLSFRDDLTGAFNRRHLDEVLRTTLDRAGIDREPFVFALVDLDNFKQLNDRLGHAAGDEALVRFVATAQAILRSSDCFARLGGDEFALLLPRTTYDTGVQIVERLRAVVHEASIPAGASILTFSAGVIEHRGATQGSIDEGPLVLADRALYAAKRAGRDQVRGHGVGQASGRDLHVAEQLGRHHQDDMTRAEIG